MESKSYQGNRSSGGGGGGGGGGDDGGGGGGGGGEAVLQPDTFAILLLLSKLVPSATAQETTAGALDLEAFVPLVRACDAPPS